MKVSFEMTESGLLELSKSELVLDFNGPVNGKQSSKKFNFFFHTNDTTNINEDETISDETTNTNNEEQTLNKTKSPELSLKKYITVLHALPLTGTSYDESKLRIEKANILESMKKKRETTLNLIESLIIEAKNNLVLEEYETCATSEELKVIAESFENELEWIYNEGLGATLDECEGKFKKLNKLMNTIYTRHWDYKERPSTIKTLETDVAEAENVVASINDLITKYEFEKEILSQNEQEDLFKIVSEAKNALHDVKAQNLEKCSDPVKWSVKALVKKNKLLNNVITDTIKKINLWKTKLAKESSSYTESNSLNSSDTTKNIKKDVFEEREKKIENKNKEHGELYSNFFKQFDRTP